MSRSPLSAAVFLSVIGQLFGFLCRSPFQKNCFFFHPLFPVLFPSSLGQTLTTLIFFSPLYTPVQLIWGFFRFGSFFSIPHFWRFFFSFLFFSRRTPVQNYNLWYPFLRITLPLHVAVLFLLSDNFSGFLNLLNFFNWIFFPIYFFFTLVSLSLSFVLSFHPCYPNPTYETFLVILHPAAKLIGFFFYRVHEHFLFWCLFLFFNRISISFFF